MKLSPYKIGAALYITWGILHLFAAKTVYDLGKNLEPGMIQGRLYQDAWNLLFFAIFGIAVAIIYNWKNNRIGYWLNAIVVGVTDIGFIITILVPGYLSLFPGLMGPILWVLALFFTTLGMKETKQAS